MEKEKFIFGFTAEGDNCAVHFNGAGQDIIAGLILMMRNNKDFKQMMIAALDIYEGMDEEVFNQMEMSDEGKSERED